MQVGTYDILKNIAHRVAAGETITIAPDWGLGTGTLVLQDGSHTHFGADVEDDPKNAADDFIKGLGDLLVNGCGLSVATHFPTEQQAQTIQAIARMERAERRVAELEGLIYRHVDPCHLQGGDLALATEINERMCPKGEPTF